MNPELTQIVAAIGATLGTMAFLATLAMKRSHERDVRAMIAEHELSKGRADRVLKHLGKVVAWIQGHSDLVVFAEPIGNTGVHDVAIRDPETGESISAFLANADLEPIAAPIAGKNQHWDPGANDVAGYIRGAEDLRDPRRPRKRIEVDDRRKI